MAKTKKGKKDDPEKKAALQAKKEAKADKAALKRLRKESDGTQSASQTATIGTGGDRELDDWLKQYRQDLVVDKAVVEDLKSNFPPPRANSTLTLYEDSSKRKRAEEFYLFGGEYHDGLTSVVVNHLLQLKLVVTLDGKSHHQSCCRWNRIHTPTAPPPRCAHATVQYNHALYVFGGEMAAGDGQYHHYKDCWRFDLRKLEWTEIKCSNSKTFAPSPRSGHAAVVWKHYMIVFGGFFDSARDASSLPKWFQDTYVLDLQTHTWLDIPHSKLSTKPDKRSASNVAVLGDDLIVHGGFSKLDKKGSSSAMMSPTGTTTAAAASSGAVVVVSSNTVVVSAETKVHTDAWKLPLKPLVLGKLAWERLTWSVQRGSTSSSSSSNATTGSTSTASNTIGRFNPCGRSGTASAGYKDRSLLVFGGVVDAEHLHHKLDSVFYNDLHVLDLERRKWFPLHLRKGSNNITNKPRRRRCKDQEITPFQHQQELATSVEEQDDKVEEQRSSHDESESDDELEEEDGTDENSKEHEGWDLTKLRSNMFAFLDGGGNVVYENIEEEEEKKSTEEEEEEEKEEEKEEEEEEKDSMGDAILKVATIHDSKHKSVKTVRSSSVMIVSPETKAPEAVVREEPLPRINANLTVSGHILYLYGGLVEVGDREVTLDDFWRLDLRKREQWECLFPGSMHKQVWRGAIHDDDDSYVSGDRSGTCDNEEDDDDSSSDEDGEESDSERQKPKSNVELTQANPDMKDSGNLGDSNLTLLPGESLADFYARTSSFWIEEAAASLGVRDSSLSKKHLKREAFRLAKERVAELDCLQGQFQGLAVSEKKPKDKRKSSKRTM